jgi:outer membrane protein
MNIHAQKKRRRHRSSIDLALLGGVALAGAAATTPAMAEADDDAANTSTFLGQGTSIVIGAGPLLSPAYDGAKKEKVGPFPFIKIDGVWHDHISVSTGRGIGVNLLGSGPWQAGFSLGYSGGRSESDDPRLRGLSDISSAVAPGAFVSYEFHAFTFDLDVKDRLGNDPGAEATLSGRYSFSPLPKLRLSVGPSITFADKRYNQTFFGVTASEAVRATALGNPLHAYRANAGAKDAGLSMIGFYQLGGHWSLGGIVGVSELLGKDAESPLTQHRLQPEVGLGILYKF